MIITCENPVLSIIVTAHNCEVYLEKCLESIIRSVGEAFNSEIILIDDASEDRTPEICSHFSQIHANVKLFRVNYKNIGKVRNFALEQCTGQYITMIDGDDEVIPGAFSDIMSILTTSKPDLLLTRLNEVYPPSSSANYEWARITPSRISQDEAITKFLIHREVQAHFIGQFFRRDILKGMQFPEFSCYEDAYLFPSVLVKCSSILFLPTGPYLYFKRSNGLSSSIDAKKVSMLIQATEQMAVAFGEDYNNLIACHWIIILHRYSDIRNESDRARIRQFMNRISAFSFLCDPKVKIGFKKKYLKFRFSGVL